MNGAHLHMVVNHFPIIGTIVGLGILVGGMILKNNTVKNIAYCVFVVGAIFAAISMATGDDAEEMVVKMPTIGRHIIHEHEEMAEKLAILLYLLGIISLIGLYSNFRKKQKTTLISYLALILVIVAVFLAKETGTSGGEIRHTEIRPATNTSNLPNNKMDNDD